MLLRVLAASRYLIIIAVIGAFLTAALLLIYGGLTLIHIVIVAFTQEPFSASGAKYLSVESIGLIEVFLLGTVLYLVSFGLYILFINDRLPAPRWLDILSLDDLKEKLLGVIVVLLAVTFLGYMVDWDGSFTIIAPGVATGLVLFALALFILNRNGRQQRSTPTDTEF